MVANEASLPASAGEEGSPLETYRTGSKLDRVRLMRIFDVCGLEDAIEEISKACETMGSHAGLTINQRATQDLCDFENQCQNNAVQPISPSNGSKTAGELKSLSIIVLDNIASVFGPELLKNPVRGKFLTFAFPKSSPLECVTSLCRLICPVLRRLMR